MGKSEYIPKIGIRKSLALIGCTYRRFLLVPKCCLTDAQTYRFCQFWPDLDLAQKKGRYDASYSMGSSF